MSLLPKDIRLYSINKNIAFEARMINKLITKILRRILSLAAFPSKVVFSERIIEYPLLFQYLDRNWRSILDFGCVEDLLPIHLSSLGYNVTGLDFRSYPFTHSNLKFIQTDILSWEPPEAQYDCCISISTIEHVGLEGYQR